MVSISDTTAFGLRMGAAFDNPYGNLYLALENTRLNSSQDNFFTNPMAGVPVINPPLINFGRESGAYDFGLMLGSTMFTPGMYTDSIHWNFDIGLANPFAGENNQAYIAAMLNNTHWDFSIPSFGYGINLGNLGDLSLGSNVSFGGGNTSASVVAADDASKINNSDKAKFERKARLLEKVSEDYKQQIASIRATIRGDYKKGIEKLDELLKDANKSDVQKAVIELYKEDRKSRLEKSKEISNAWATKIANGTSANDFKVDVSSVNSDNILDVLGTFITNDKLSKGDWNILINNNEDIIKKLVSKAKDMKSSLTEEQKTKIDSLIKDIEDSKFKGIPYRIENQEDKVYNLFIYLRKIQAEENDTDVAKRYGTDDITVTTSEAADQMNNEKDAYTKIRSVFEYTT